MWAVSSGAAERLTNQLMYELLEQIRARYAGHGQVHLHYLGMPLALRSGGLRTHWMLPSEVTLHRPDTLAAGACDADADEVELSDTVTRAVIDALHTATPAGAPHGRVAAEHERDIVAELRKQGADANCTDMQLLAAFWRWFDADGFTLDRSCWEGLTQSLQTGSA